MIIKSSVANPRRVRVSSAGPVAALAISAAQAKQAASAPAAGQARQSQPQFALAA